MSSSGYSATDKAKWSANLIAFIQGQYSIDKSRMAFGGYSSGAQWTTEFFGPGFASELMNDGVAVAISYGGSPKVQTQFTPAFKTRVPFLWDVGDADPAYEKSGQYGVIAGYNWYTSNGFVTELNVIRGLGHNRSGQFGAIMDAAIKKHVGGTTRISSKNDIWLQKNTGDCIFDRVKKSAQLSIRGAILPIIKVHIYTLAGREITASFTQIIRGNVITLSCDCRHLTENLHIVEMEIDGVSISKKMLVR
jgi:hypothetical protein